MNVSVRDQIALTLARGAVALVMTIALGAFGRAFVLSVMTGTDHAISDSATQLLTALGSALVGGAVGFIGGSGTRQRQQAPDDEEPSE